MEFSDDVLKRAMKAALTEARAAAATGEFPYGAVVIDRSGAIVARARDTVARDRDPTMHAEIEAVRKAVRAVGPDLTGHALVSNGEPCAMCSTAAWWARISLIAFGIRQADLHRMRPDSMDEPGLTIEEAMAPFKRGIAVRDDILNDACRAIWENPDSSGQA
ncbi:MAG: nucleoside deaminase [Pseudomonadota bacterium]